MALRECPDRTSAKISVELRAVVKPELIIFDMDGLMFDTERIAYISWIQAALMYGYEIDEAIFKQTIGANLCKTKEIYVKHFGNGFPIAEVTYARFSIAENLIKTNGVEVKNGLYELLDYLKDINIKKAVATSTNRDRALSLLDRASIDTYFDYILCGDEIQHGKPNPEIFLKVAEKVGCQPKNSFVLEDSEVGVIAAYHAGMLPILIPDMIVPDEEVRILAFRQMENLLEARGFFKSMFGPAYKGPCPSNT